MRYLGIDYGKAKVGLAISEGQLASPLTILSVKSLKDALQQVLQLIHKNKIELVVIGLPESGEARSITQKFITKLRQASSLPISQTEETLSSYQARNLMIELKGSAKNEDAQAAAIILQNYLENEK